jgi:rod shape-determining protein MreC
LRKKYLSWIIIVIFCVVFINLPRIRDNFLISGIRTALVSMVYPVQYVTHAALTAVIGRAANLVQLFGAVGENAKLKQTVAELKARTAAYDSLAAENAELKRALGFYSRDLHGYRLQPARVVGSGGSNLFAALLIDRGTRHGLTRDSVVVSELGLVGRVDEVFPYVARVQLVTDPGLLISVQDARSRDFGVAVGCAQNRIRLQYIPSASDIRVGDSIVTGGRGDIFPAGILIGKVGKADKNNYDLFQTISVVPAVDPAKLDVVFVVRSN